MGRAFFGGDFWGLVELFGGARGTGGVAGRCKTERGGGAALAA